MAISLENFTMISGNCVAGGRKFAICAARWHSEFTETLIEEALETLVRYGASDEDILVVRVPGCFELPVVCKRLASSGNFSAVIALGTLIKGDTLHFELIAREITSSLSYIAVDTGIPVTLGVITAIDEQQAAERSGQSSQNKGREAALAALEAADVMSQMTLRKVA